jgi:hypothetical protein
MYKRELSEVIFRIREGLHSLPSVLPIRIHCPRTPYPNVRDTKYVDPSHPQNEIQKLALE